VDEGVDRTTVVTTTVLPLEMERNVDWESEGVGVGLGGGVGEEVEKVVEVGRLELDWLERVSEVDDERDVELLPGVVLGGIVDDEDSLEVDTGVELGKHHQMLNIPPLLFVTQKNTHGGGGGVDVGVPGGGPRVWKRR